MIRQFSGNFKKISLFNFTRLVCLYIFAANIFLGCKDDPVKPQVSEFDPPRFNWRTMPLTNLANGFAGMWALDTGKVFLLHFYNKSLVIASGGNIFSNYIGNYGLNEIEGISNNEVYIFGISVYPDNKLTIIRWNGAGFEYYDTGVIVYTGFNIDIKGCVVSSSEIWILSRQGIVRFDGINMHKYPYEDTLLAPKDLFLSKENRVQYIAERWDEQEIQDCLYEFRDTGFVKIFEHIENPNLGMTYTFLKQISGNKFGLQLNRPINSGWTTCIYNFLDSSFIPNFCFNKAIQTPPPTENMCQAGSNLQNFIAITEAERGFFEHTRIGVIHWNGIKVSKEFELGFTFWGPFVEDILFMINQDNFLVLEPGVNIQNPPKLFYGSKK